MDDPHHFGQPPIESLASTCPRCHNLVFERAKRYAKLGPDVVRWRGADDWIEPATVVRLVAEGRP
jgi:hypothetical protein